MVLVEQSINLYQGHLFPLHTSQFFLLSFAFPCTVPSSASRSRPVFFFLRCQCELKSVLSLFVSETTRNETTSNEKHCANNKVALQ